jgi:predicted HAD superfamily Cof-like phosphohydrolase
MNRAIIDTFLDVESFMISCGHTVSENNILQSELYYRLIVEEFNEFIQAKKENDDVELADACFDMIWVIAGYMLSKGWNCHDIWNEGADSNFKKVDPVTGKVKRREDGKILKPDGWVKPDFSKFVK